MKAVECVNCGAALPADPDQGPVRCGYCQTLNERTVARRLPAPQRPRGAGRRLLFAGAGCAVLLAGVTAAVALLAVGRRPPAPRVPARTPFALPTLAKPTYTPADLARTTDRGWLELRLAPPPTPYGGFEPVACLPWALSVAQAWAADAGLERIDVKRLRSDGRVNVQDDQEAEVMYRFLSPAQIREYGRQAELSSRASVAYGFFLKLEKGKATALIRDGKPHPDDKVLDHPKALPLPRLLQVATATGRFPEKPFYAGYLIRLREEGWVWYLNSLSGRDSLPRLSAETGRPTR